MRPTLGFIGLGAMGGLVATWLAKNNWDLVVHDQNDKAVSELISHGARSADSPKSVSDQVDVVVTNLLFPQVMRDVMLGRNGVIHGSRARTTIELSTCGPRATQEVATALAEREIILLDAPVSGNTQDANQGKLTIMVSGPAERIRQAKPVLDSLAQRVVIVGDRPGLGQTMKLIGHFLSATALAASAEAVVVGVKAGLDPERMMEVLNNGSGKNSATLDKIPNDVMPRTFNHGFAINLLYKDVRLYLEEAEALDVPTWVGNSVRQLWMQSQMKSGPEADCTRIFELLEEWAGAKVGAV
jgi:3-hydroxyisobutyrate dehydrogenase-like beta-hydroxyacid dehydrogenase